jgi:hypothetical protein
MSKPKRLRSAAPEPLDEHTVIALAQLVLRRMEVEGTLSEPLTCVTEGFRALAHIASVRPEFVRRLARWYADDGVARTREEYDGVAELWVSSAQDGARAVRKRGSQ